MQISFEPGEYVINLLHYKSNFKDPLPVMVKVEKLNPTVELIYVSDDREKLQYGVIGVVTVLHLLRCGAKYVHSEIVK